MRGLNFFTFLIFLNSSIIAQDISQSIDNDTTLINRLISQKKHNENLGLEIASDSKNLCSIESGSIFLLNGDTLTGKIEILRFPSVPMPVKVKFQNEKVINSSEKIRADKIIGFKKGNKYYFSKKTNDLPPFYIERIENGKINLYTYRYKIKSGGNGLPVNIIHVVDYYIEINNNLIRIDDENIEPLLIDKFSDKIQFFKKLTDKKKGINKLISQDKYEFNTCDYILELVQLYNELYKN